MLTSTSALTSTPAWPTRTSNFGRLFRVLTIGFTLLFGSLLSQSAWSAPSAELIDFWNDHEVKSTMAVNHEVWQSLLDKYLDDQHASGINRFNYAAVTAVDRARLNDYLKYLQSNEPRQLNLSEQKAFWINLYNAKTVALVIKGVQSDNIESIREIKSGFFRPGPWQLENMQIAQQKLSLNDIEHGILRPIFNDKRIHYVLNCASLGCPNLLKTAFTISNTEALMEKAQEDFLSHPRAARMHRSELILSQIFDWYGSDFAQDLDGLIAYLKPFLKADTAAGLGSRTGVEFEYDWGLNKP